jgi:hypothetical protein
VAGRSVAPVVILGVGMALVARTARLAQAVVRTLPVRQQARTADTLAAQAAQGQQAVPRAPMVAIAARMAARMAAPQRHQQVGRLQQAPIAHIQHRAAQEAGCGHNSFTKK